ncbi:MAG: hypothetical protein DHS20C18_15580 [Saprospiraceae bacterium]|nr:MAG: hypothetical protein DHS20C18_15580 [Saprospiraceae bacterium]
MRLALSTLFMLIGLILLKAQPVAHGKILDAVTKDPVPFVNIGFKKLAVGTVSDEAGNFELKIASQNDSVSISSIGYYELNIVGSDLLKAEEIELVPRQYAIPEVEITAEILEETAVVLGYNSDEKKQSVGFGSRQLGTEIGALIKIEKETYLKSAHFILNHAKGDSLLFRVNIYDFQDGKVGENLLKQNVIITTPQKKGTLDVDLTEYGIVTDHDVLLSLEWIKNDQGSGNVGITFQAKKSRSLDNFYNKETSFADFRKLSDLFPSAPHFYVGFYVVAKQVGR